MCFENVPVVFSLIFDAHVSLGSPHERVLSEVLSPHPLSLMCVVYSLPYALHSLTGQVYHQTKRSARV